MASFALRVIGGIMEVKDYRRKNAQEILKFMPEDVEDLVFKELEEWL